MFRQRGTFESCACVMARFHLTRIYYAVFMLGLVLVSLVKTWL